MISNYLYTIGKQLSPKTRDEVLKDIEVNLYDYLEQNFGIKDYSDAELEAAIRSMGHPRQVAEAYRNQPRGLIGPAYIDTYWLVIKIAVIGIAVGLTVANVINLSSYENGVHLFLGIFSQISQASLTSIGIITLIFSAVQHYNPEDIIEKDEPWSLKILEKAVESQQKVSLSNLIVETFFLCLAIVFINQSSSFVSAGEKVFLIFNNPAFGQYLLWFNVILIASLAMNLYLLIRRKWQPTTRILGILLNIAGIVIFTIFAFDSNVWNFQGLEGYFGAEQANIENWITFSIYFGLAGVVIISAFDIFGHLKGLVRRKK